jgi:hypothetical protein
MLVSLTCSLTFVDLEAYLACQFGEQKSNLVQVAPEGVLLADFPIIFAVLCALIGSHSESVALGRILVNTVVPQRPTPTL